MEVSAGAVWSSSPGSPARMKLNPTDFVPLAEFAFQHWDRCSGEPFAHIRPLSEDTAERVWRQAQQFASAAWNEADELDRFDLREDGWSRDDVCAWLRARVDDPQRDVIVCFQPRVAVVLPWSVVCDHWLTVLWTGGCVWPVSPSASTWILVHDGDQFAFARG